MVTSTLKLLAITAAEESNKGLLYEQDAHEFVKAFGQKLDLAPSEIKQAQKVFVQTLADLKR